MPDPSEQTAPTGAAAPGPDLVDVAYGPHERNVLDFWRSRADTPAPMAVYIHGGGFRMGDKSTLSPLRLNLCLDAGFCVAAINYRLSDTVSFPAFMHDAGRALQYMRHHANAWGIDPTRVAATGGSAGGGISLWLGFHNDLANPQSPDPIARQSTRLQCMGLFNTQCSYDPRFYQASGLAPAATHPFLLPYYGLSASELDTPRAHAMFDEASPMTHFHAQGPPVFLWYPNDETPLPPEAADASQVMANGTADENDIPEAHPLAGRAVHHPSMGRLIQQRLEALGVDCELHLNCPRDDPQTLAQMVAFFQNHLGR